MAEGGGSLPRGWETLLEFQLLALTAVGIWESESVDGGRGVISVSAFQI